MLSAYQTALLNLIQTPQQSVPLISSAQQTVFINTARQQLAGDAECVRCNGTLALAANTQAYPFSIIGSFTLVGVSGVLAVRKGFIAGTELNIRAWEWFESYYLYSGSSGVPVRCGQQGQGAGGTLFFDPVPTAVGSVVLDVVGLPEPLANDSTPEAIPYPWTDAVPFYAAWLAFQNLVRQADADAMLAHYTDLVRRGRQESTPTVLPDNLPGGPGAILAATHQQLTVPPQASGQR